MPILGAVISLRETIEVGGAPQEAFAYVADFANTQEWDPGVREAEKLTDGSVDVGTEYRVVAEFRGREIPMRYRVVRFEPPGRVVLEGEGRTVSAVDDIRFEPTGRGTRIVYAADLEMKGLLRLLEPFLRGAFVTMGRRALDGLARQLGP